MEVIKETLVVAFLLISGIVMIINPMFVWKVDHYFTVKDGEPTDLYIQLVRIVGVVCILVAVIGGLIFLIHGR